MKMETDRNMLAKSSTAHMTIPDIEPNYADQNRDNTQSRPVIEAEKYWQTLGFSEDGEGGFIMPKPLMVLQTSGDMDTQQRLAGLLSTLGVPPRLWAKTECQNVVVYRKPDGLPIIQMRRQLPEGISLHLPGDVITLPSAADWSPSEHTPRTIDDVPELDLDSLAHLTNPEPVIDRNPLLAFSLRGQSEQFQAMMVASKPLLGNVCLRGQVTVWYAGPNTGKTLIALKLLTDAVMEGRIAAGNIFYVNADDSGLGFATKLQLMDDLGVNTLAPGFKGFKAAELITLLNAMADKDEAKGVFIIVDTLKKFTDLMDKKELSRFAQACRRVSMMGGTVLSLAHTTKNPNSDGSPRYAGVTDFLEDADAAYTISLLKGSNDTNERVVEFSCIKARGDNAERAAYAYAAEKGISYDELLASVRSVDGEQLDGFKRVEAQRSDAEMIAAVATCIEEGINTKMVLGQEVASRMKISGRAAGKLIERYTGTDPAQHRWRFKRAARGAQVFELLTPPADAGTA